MSPPSEARPNILKLKADLEKLTPAQKLLIASQLAEHGGKDELAETIADMAVNELSAKRLFAGDKK